LGLLLILGEFGGLMQGVVLQLLLPGLVCGLCMFSINKVSTLEGSDTWLRILVAEKAGLINVKIEWPEANLKVRVLGFVVVPWRTRLFDAGCGVGVVVAVSGVRFVHVVNQEVVQPGGHRHVAAHPGG
jgi:hypothetical protein